MDAWDKPIWYDYNARSKTGYIMSSGEDQTEGTPDDFIFDPRNNKVVKAEDAE